MSGHGRPLLPHPTRPRSHRQPRPDLHAAPGDGSLPRTEAVKDELFRRWDVVTPSATLIGRSEAPGEDVGENVRRLHEERHPAMAGHSARMHRLDKVRITHALCSRLDVTGWERDRALGIVAELDLTAFGSQRAVEKVALVVIQHVVDAERMHRLGLDDEEWVASQPPGRFEELFERFTSIKEATAFQEALDAVGLDTTSLNRLNRTLQDQLDEQDIREVALGRSPHRDASHPWRVGAREASPDGANDSPSGASDD